MKKTSKNSPSSKVRHITIDENNELQRVDNFLMAKFRGVPKSAIYKVIRKGNVRVNKGRVAPSYKLQIGDIVRVPPISSATSDNPKPLAKPNKSLLESVIYEDDYLLILNKPSGLAVHGGSGVSLGLIESLRSLKPEYKNLELVHRLDRDTSGCILVSKKRSALRALHEMLRDGKINKIYHALVLGHTPKQFISKEPLRKNQLKSGERIVRVDSDGQPALTKFKLLDKFINSSLIEARPISGRTHQIRVHAQSKGNPIAGDIKYGDKKFNTLMKNFGLKRLFLHAHKLEFEHPKLDKKISVSASYDKNLENVLKSLYEELENE